LTSSRLKRQSVHLPYLIFSVLALLLSACSSPASDLYHGYVEGEFVYVASPLPGVVTLNVTKGGVVKKGDPLFVLESDAERSSRDEAQRRLAQAQAGLRDAGKGLRPTEIAALNAQLRQAKSALTFAATELGRQEKLYRDGVVSAQSLDSARTVRDQQLQSVARIEADLKTAALGARNDQVAGFEANVRALEAALVRAEWELSQKSRKAPEAATVFDTLPGSGSGPGRVGAFPEKPQGSGSGYGFRYPLPQRRVGRSRQTGRIASSSCRSQSAGICPRGQAGVNPCQRSGNGHC